MGDKLNAILDEVQAVSLQFDLLFGARMDFNPENVEGANWNLQDQPMEEKSAPQTVPLQGENNPVSPAGTAPQKEPAAQVPTFGTIVPPYVPPFYGIYGSSSIPPIQEKKKSPSGFEFPLVFAPTSVQNPHPSGSMFHNSGTQNIIAPQVQNSPAQNKSFPNVSWKPKEPQVFTGKNTKDVHSWTEVVSH